MAAVLIAATQAVTTFRRRRFSSHPTRAVGEPVEACIQASVFQIGLGALRTGVLAVNPGE